MTEQDFCPLIRGTCREDCAWYHSFITISPDGADRDDYCAVSVIADKLCDMADLEEGRDD